MKRFLLLITTICLIFLQTGTASAQIILATGYAPVQDDLRALLIDAEKDTVTDLGFNGSFLPLWKGDSILVSTSAGVWLVSSDGIRMKKLHSGNRVFLSPSREKEASLSNGGIILYNFSSSTYKEVMLNAAPDAAITWLPDGKTITYLDAERQETYLFNPETETVTQFGKKILQPVWSPAGDYFIYQKQQNGKYGIYLGHGSVPLPTDSLISTGAGNDLVPIISPDGNKIFYLKLIVTSTAALANSILPCELWEYNRTTYLHRFLTAGAGYTDGFYPQLSFDSVNEILYYTSLGLNGFESNISAFNIKKNSVQTFQGGYYKDIRFPMIKTTP